MDSKMFFNTKSMTKENDSPATPADPDEVQVKAGPGMEIDPEPSKDETKVEEGGTSKKDAEEASDSPKEPETPEKKEEPEGEAEGDAKRSSKLIADLGEDRKRLASELITLAKSSEVAAERVKGLMESDPKMEKLIKTKFGDDYDRIVSGEISVEQPEEAPDLEQLKEQARVEAKAEVIMKAAEEAKSKQLETFAQSHGLNSDELEQVKENAEILEGKYGYEAALDVALRIVNVDKAEAKKGETSLPTGGDAKGESKTPKTSVTPELKDYTSRMFGNSRKPEQIAEGIDRVEKNIGPDGKYRLSLDD